MRANINRTCENCGEPDFIQIVVTTDDRTVISNVCNECVDQELDDIRKILKLGKIGMAMLQAQELQEMVDELNS